MSHITNRSLLAMLTLSLGLVSTQAADPEKKPCPTAAGNPVCCKLLKGVVHLNDDDVRFARKGGGPVFVDPTTGPEAAQAIAPWHAKPALILITHPHGDHFQPAVLQEYIKTNPEVVLAGPAEVVELAKAKGITMQTVAPNQSYTLAGVEIRTVPAYFEQEKAGHPQAAGWVGYVLQLNGARYYVTGDTQALPTMAQAKADVVFPLLFGCGGNSDQALKMARLSGAKLVVPVHHANQKESIKKFLAQIPAETQSACFVGGKLSPTL